MYGVVLLYTVVAAVNWPGELETDHWGYGTRHDCLDLIDGGSSRGMASKRWEILNRSIYVPWYGKVGLEMKSYECKDSWIGQFGPIPDKRPSSWCFCSLFLKKIVSLFPGMWNGRWRWKDEFMTYPKKTPLVAIFASLFTKTYEPLPAYSPEYITVTGRVIHSVWT
jgi:hypothetical protein